MKEKHPSSENLIRSCLNTHYGIEIASLTLLPLGADRNAAVYKVEAPDGKLYFVKLKRGHDHDVGVEIVKLLHERGIEEIIAPLKTMQGRLSQRMGDFTLIVYPFIQGEDGFSRALTDNQWIKLGKALRKVHETDVPPAIQKRVRKETYSTKWREVVRSLYIPMQNEPVNDDISLKLAKFMKEHMQVIHRLVDRAEQLAQKLRDETSELVLCHSDIHGGNVLMEGNDIIYLVDWDDPIMAPKERDLMFIGGGVGNVWNKPHEETLFYRGYGKTEVNSEILAYYRHERIVEDIAEYGEELLLRADTAADKSKKYKQFLAMFEPQGVVEIAFKTDEEKF